MRNKGTFNFSGNLEVKKDAPLEAGSIVPTYADLTKAETWTDEEGSVWVYKGKNVTCEDRPGKLYQLTSTDYTKTSNWVEIGGGGTGGGIAEAPEDGKLYGRQNATWSEINDLILLPSMIITISQHSSSEEILEVFGGLESFKALMIKIASSNKPLAIADSNQSSSTSAFVIYHTCSYVESTSKITIEVMYQLGTAIYDMVIRYENETASATVNSLLYQTNKDLEVYYFEPGISQGKISQEEYTALQNAITKKKVIMTYVGMADLSTTGSRIPVAAYTIDNEISLNFVIDQDSAYPLWVYIHINGSTRDITVTKRIMGQTSKAISGEATLENGTFTGEQYTTFINNLFGSISNFQNVVKDIAQNHSEYHITFPNIDSHYQLSNTVAYCDISTNSYVLIFTMGYMAANYSMGIKLVYINTEGWVKISDLMQSNNLTTATKISATDYAALDPKDTSTMYAVTE